MSRHVTRTHQYGVVFGWDPPLQTFFAQVHDFNAKNEERGIIKWWGVKYREIPEPEIIEELVAPWAYISEEMIETLRDDERENRA